MIFCLLLFIGINCLFPKNVEGIGLSLPLKCYEDNAFDDYFEDNDSNDLNFENLKIMAKSEKVGLSASEVDKVEDKDIKHLKRLIIEKVAKDEDIDKNALLGFPCTDLPNVEGWIDFKNEQKKNCYGYKGKGYIGNLSTTANGNKCKTN